MSLRSHALYDPELLDVYRTEAEDHLASIGDALIELRRNPFHPSAVQNIRRRMHTLKGAAATVGLTSSAHLAHRLEDLIEHAGGGRNVVSPEILELISQAAHVLHKMDGSFDEDSYHDELCDLHARIDGTLSGEPAKVAPSFRSSSQVPEVAQTFPPTTNVHLQVLRVSRSHLEGLTEMVDELLAQSSRLDRTQRQLVARMRATLSGMRLLPLRMLAPRLERIVRVAAQQEQKKAALVLHGDNVSVDTAIVEQLVDPLMHLIRNAVGHGIELPAVRHALDKPGHGTIEVRARIEDDTLVLDVEDDGAGLNYPAIREQAVRRGFLTAEQAESISQSELCRLVLSPGFTTARKVSQMSGRGVGLDVVQEALRVVDGTIAIHSIAGRRTVVTLRIPLPVPPNGDVNVIEPEPVAPAIQTIMIVDDSPSMRRSNAAVIRKAGWGVITASDGLEALDKLQRLAQRPAAIVLDVEMPRMDGFSLLTNLRTREEYDNIPVILLTSRETDDVRRQAHGLAVSAYLVKPCQGEVLISHLRQLTT